MCPHFTINIQVEPLNQIMQFCKTFCSLSVCRSPEPFRWWLLLLYSLLSREDRAPFSALLASMHPWGPCNLFSSGGGSGGGGRSKQKEVEGTACMENVSLEYKEHHSSSLFSSTFYCQVSLTWQLYTAFKKENLFMLSVFQCIIERT